MAGEPATEAMSALIRRAAGYGHPGEGPQDAEPEREQARDPEFGAGAGNRKAMPVEESMSDLIRASFYGAWRRSGP